MSSFFKPGFVSLIAVAQATCLSSAAYGQDTASGGSGANEAVGDAIIVTAERRATALEKTPVAITVFTQSDLGANQIDTGADLIKFTPGLQGGNNVGNSAASSFFIRGLGQDDSSPLVDSAVGVYIDDVYVARQYSNNLFLFDIDQVEVLRGPQGILYGRNTSGGAIKVTTAKPSPEFGAKLDAEYGNYDAYSVKGSVNLPITDKLYFRGGAFTRQREDGFVVNATTGLPTTLVDQWGGRAQLRFVPTEELTIDASIDAFTSNTPGDTSANVLPEDSDLFVTRSGITNAFSDITDLRASLTVTYESDDYTLKSISAFDNPEWTYRNDFSGLPTPIFILEADYSSKIYSQEFQFAGDHMDGRLQSTIGVFGYLENGDNFDRQNVFSGLIDDLNVYTNRTRSLAAYGQLRFNVTDALSISAGLRYTDEKRRIDITGFSLTSGMPVETYDNDDIIAAGNDVRLHNTKLSPKLGFEYDISSAVMAYASYTEGFRSGSFNQRAFNAADITSFDPEEVVAYEAGIKGLFLDRRLRTSIAVYRNDYNNFIINQLNPQTGNFVSANAAEVRIQGIEGEISFQATPALTLRATTAILDAEYRRLDVGAGFPEGNEVKFTPPFTASVGFDWQPDMQLEPRLTASYFHSARYYVGLQNFDSEHVPLRDLVDAQFSIKPTQTMTLGVFCENCLDDRYFTTTVAAAVLGFETQTVGNPRTYGVRLSYEY